MVFKDLFVERGHGGDSHDLLYLGIDRVAIPIAALHS